MAPQRLNPKDRTMPRQTTQPSSQALRVGVLGAANIARQFVAAVRDCPDVQVVAVASRSADKAAAFGDALGVPRRYASYEALLADSSLDIIYNPLPNTLHAPWSIKALDAGFHVLCEKPLAMDAAEARRMFVAAQRNDRFLLEAYPYWFQPQTRDMLELIHGGVLGRIRYVQASFGFTMSNPVGNIRHNPDLGGGALRDAGCYALSLIQLAMGRAPQRVRATPRWADTGVDIAMHASLEYEDGAHAQMSCAMDVAYQRHALIVGDRGSLETEYPNHNGQPLLGQMRVRRGPGNQVPYEIVTSAPGSGFRFSAEAFAQKIRAGDAPALARAAQASIDIAATLEAIAQSATTGQAVEIAN